MAASRTPAATNAFPTGRSHYGNERETKARIGAKANLRAHEGAGNRWPCDLEDGGRAVGARLASNALARKLSPFLYALRG